MDITNNITTAPLAEFRRARDELSAAALRGEGGRAAHARFSDAVDALLRQFFASVPTPKRSAAILALGGYGRRQLCVHSDIDVLVLFDGRIRSEEEGFVRAFLHRLWDLGVTVGHQVRALADFKRVETDNPEFLLALLEARPVAGDETLIAQFGERFQKRSTYEMILPLLFDLIDERHAQFDGTIYQLQPDVKNAPGALRDLQARRAIGQLIGPGVGDATDAARLDAAEDFLLRLRSVLHALGKRNQNVLTHELQDKTAELLGYDDGHPQQRVERLMSDYFRAARSISRALASARKSTRPASTTPPVPIDRNLELSSGGVGFVDRAAAAEQPRTWVRLFRAALTLGAPVADEALACIQQHVQRYAPDTFVETASDRADLLALLRPRAGLYGRLSQMHECGLLERIFPEFEAISCRVVRDFYHKYTVDEHTLRTIGNLERLATGESTPRARFASLLEDLEAPELLVLSLLYHDVGKWRDDDHAAESVRMARRMYERLDLPQASREIVEFLIASHLQMSRVAFRRDTEDPEIVRRFADLVGIEDRLKMLCLMTLADVDAVGPGTLTPWKEELLWRLYVDTYNHLTLGYADELIGAAQAGVSDPAGVARLMAGRPPDLSEADVLRFLEGLPRRYLQLFAPDAVYRHVRLARDIHPDDVHLSLDQKGNAWELAVAMLDRPFLFSNISGALSSFGMDILRGQAMTTPNGLVLDVFQFTDRERFLELNPGARGQFLQVLQDAAAGRLDITTRLRGREQSVLNRRGLPRVPPVIHCDNESSRGYTILDIIADDAIGLLYRISRVISQNGCDVDLVLISTEGKKAIDVFHITKGGAKLDEPAQHALMGDLQRMLEGRE